MLVDFYTGACKVLGVAYPERTVFDYGWLPKVTGLSNIDFLNALDAHPNFWRDLEMSPGMDALVTYLDCNFPDWMLLTHATHNSASWAGKQEWVQRYLQKSGLHRLVQMHGDKSRFATPGAILIDDVMGNCMAWHRQDGRDILWRCYSNDMLCEQTAQIAGAIEILQQVRFGG